MINPLKIGITGGIGSGKSYVSRLLEERGIPVYDTDSAAKRLMVECTGVRNSLTALLGADAYTPDGTLNKPRIASFLFSSPENASQINAIVHPAVKADFLAWASERCGVVAMECAILFEAGFSDVVDFVVSVEAPLQVRVRRAMKRDNASEENVLSRIKAQTTDEERRRRSQFVIENDGVQPLSPQIDKLVSLLEGDATFG